MVVCVVFVLCVYCTSIKYRKRPLPLLVPFLLFPRSYGVYIITKTLPMLPRLHLENISIFLLGSSWGESVTSHLQLWGSVSLGPKWFRWPESDMSRWGMRNSINHAPKRKQTHTHTHTTEKVRQSPTSRQLISCVHVCACMYLCVCVCVCV